jgi:hypothetical protein
MMQSSVYQFKLWPNKFELGDDICSKFPTIKGVAYVEATEAAASVKNICKKNI